MNLLIYQVFDFLGWKEKVGIHVNILRNGVANISDQSEWFQQCPDNRKEQQGPKWKKRVWNYEFTCGKKSSWSEDMTDFVTYSSWRLGVYLYDQGLMSNCVSTEKTTIFQD